MGWQDAPVVGVAAWEQAPLKGPQRRYRRQRKAEEPNGTRALELGTRAVLQGAGSIGDLILSPFLLAGGAIQAADAWLTGNPMSPVPSVRGTIGDTLTSLGVAQPATPTERVVSGIEESLASVVSGAGLGRAIAGRAPVAAQFLTENLRSQAGAAAGAAAAGGVTREMGGGPVSQLAATVLGSAAGGWAAAPRRTDQAVELLLADRERTGAVTDAQVQQALVAQYTQAKAGITGWDDIAASNITPRFREVVAANSEQLTMTPAVRAEVDRALSMAVKETGVMTTQAMDAAQSSFGDLARKATRSGEFSAARLYGALGTAMQKDMDDALLGTVARRLRSRWAEEVIGPFGTVRKGLFDDPEVAWKAVRSAGSSDLKRLAERIDEPTRQLIRRRTVGEIIRREDAFVGGQTGSGAPEWRAMNRQGMQAFFTANEWRGLKRISGRMATLKNPAVKFVLAPAVGYGAGGVGGALGAMFLDQLATTPGGRLFMERAVRLPVRQLDVELSAVVANPGVLNAAQQVEQ